MNEHILNSVLSRLPPSKWAIATRRAETIAAYMRIQNPTMADADEAAATLGMRRRMFYNVLRDFRAAPEGPARGGERAPSKALSAEAASTIDSVMLELGPGAREAEIMRAVRDRCDRAGIPTPSSGAIRTRLGRPSKKPNLPRRLKRSGDLILDICPLAVDALGIDGEVASAGVCVLLHMQSGAVLAHTTTCGAPTTWDVSAVLHDTLSRIVGFKGAISPLSLLISTAVPAFNQGVCHLLASAGVVVDAGQSRSLRGGIPITAALGIRLGQIPFKPLHRSFAPHGQADAIPLRLLAQVVSLLIDARNSQFEGNVPAPSRRRTLSAGTSAAGTIR